MTKKQIIKLLCLNGGLALLNITLFSKGLIGLTLGEGIISTAFGITDIVMSGVAFFWGNISLIFQDNTPKLYKGGELSETKDYVEALELRRDKQVFTSEIDTTIEQIYRIRSKNEALDSILSQHFSSGKMTSVRFRSVIESVNSLFYDNVKKMLNRMTIFDYKDYQKLTERQSASKNNPANYQSDGNYSLQVSLKRMKIYDEHIDYVRNIVKMNEDILVKFDMLLLEVSKLDDFDQSNIENMTAIQEINDLIRQTKFYRQ